MKRFGKAAQWDAATEPIHTTDFAGVSTRTLLMRSANTRRMLAEVVDLLRGEFAHWQLVEVAEGGHMAPLTQADAVNTVLSDFLDDRI